MSKAEDVGMSSEKLEHIGKTMRRLIEEKKDSRNGNASCKKR